MKSPLILAPGLVVVALMLSAWSPSKLASGQVRQAMRDAGLSEANAHCMAARMTDRMSLIQLYHLRQLRGKNRTLTDYVNAVRKQGDREAIQVVASSAFRCSIGLAPEKR